MRTLAIGLLAAVSIASTANASCYSNECRDLELEQMRIESELNGQMQFETWRMQREIDEAKREHKKQLDEMRDELESLRMERNRRW